MLVHSLPLGIAAIAPDVLRSLPVVHHILPDALGIHLLQLLPVTHHVGTLGERGWLCTGCTRLGKVDVLVNVLLLLLDCCTLGCMHQAVLDQSNLVVIALTVPPPPATTTCGHLGPVSHHQLAACPLLHLLDRAAPPQSSVPDLRPDRSGLPPAPPPPQLPHPLPLQLLDDSTNPTGNLLPQPRLPGQVLRGPAHQLPFAAVL